MRLSKKSLKQIFEEFDADGSGKISLLEFKNAFRKLGIGLTSQDIDYLVNYCDKDRDGEVDYEEFASKFRPNVSESILIKRTKGKLKNIQKIINEHLISAKDAFRQFNTSRTGKMNMNEFITFLRYYTKIAKKPMPPLIVSKDLFECIDIRKDGVIDINEWSM